VSEFKLAPTTRPKPLRRKTREERAEVRTTKERNLLLAGTILAIGVAAFVIGIVILGVV